VWGKSFAKRWIFNKINKNNGAFYNIKQHKTEAQFEFLAQLFKALTHQQSSIRSMDPKAKSSLNTTSSEKSTAKHSIHNKSSKLSQKKGENIDAAVSSIPTDEIYSSDDKDKRTQTASGAKRGMDTKSVPSLVSRVSDYLDDEECADQNQSSTAKKGFGHQ
jgi:hypothetical protein